MLATIQKSFEQVQPAEQVYHWHGSAGATERTARPLMKRKATILGHTVDVWYERVDQAHIGWRAIFLDDDQAQAMMILSILHNGALSSSAISVKARRRKPWKQLQMYIFRNSQHMTFRLPE